MISYVKFRTHEAMQSKSKELRLRAISDVTLEGKERNEVE